jgi:hypothetical protein
MLKRLYTLPEPIHYIVLLVTGYRIVKIVDDDTCKETYLWSDHL